MSTCEWSFNGEALPEETMIELSPSFEELKTYLEDNDIGEYAFAVAVNTEDFDSLDIEDEDVTKKAYSLYENVVAEVKLGSNISIELNAPSGNGDHDDVWYWVAENLYIRNPNIPVRFHEKLSSFDVACWG